MRPGPLVVFGIAEESRGIRWHEFNGNVRVLHTGIGGERAAERLKREIEKARPSMVISTGFAGGLDPALKPGDIIVSGEHSAPYFLELTIATASSIDLRAKEGSILTRRFPAMSSSQKRDLFSETGALVVDMETEDLARVCEAHNIPMLAFRAVCDPATSEVPIPLEVGVDMEQGSPRILRTVCYLMRRPAAIPATIRLAFFAARARRSISLLLTHLLPLLDR